MKQIKMLKNLNNDLIEIMKKREMYRSQCQINANIILIILI